MVAWNDCNDTSRDCEFCCLCFCTCYPCPPLGALSIIVSAILAHFMLNEKLNIFGVVGCVLCVVGSTTIVFMLLMRELSHLSKKNGILLLDQLGLSLKEVISKIMANSEVAMAFQNPRVQAAIMDVMDIFNKISELFPGVSGYP